MKYLVKGTLNHNTVRYEAGDEIELSEEAAKPIAHLLEPIVEEKKSKATKAAKPTGDTPSKDSPE